MERTLQLQWLCLIKRLSFSLQRGTLPCGHLRHQQKHYVLRHVQRLSVSAVNRFLLLQRTRRYAQRGTNRRLSIDKNLAEKVTVKKRRVAGFCVSVRNFTISRTKSVENHVTPLQNQGKSGTMIGGEMVCCHRIRQARSPFPIFTAESSAYD